jgi:hypothetical protein
MQQRWIMAALGALAGLALYGLLYISDHDLLAPRPLFALAILITAFFSILIAMTGPVPLRRSAPAAAAVAVAASALLSLAALRFDDPLAFAATPFAVMSGLLVTALPVPFLMAHVSSHWRDYPGLFAAAWGIVVRGAVAWAFVALVWGVIQASNALFQVVGLHWIERLITLPVAPFLITGAVLGLAAAVVVEMAAIVTPYLVLRLLRLLVPVVLVVLAVFALALPFRGLSDLFGEFSSAAVLLCMAGGAATLVSASVDQDDAAATAAGWMQGATRALALVLAVPVGLAVWSVAERVGQYGWTPERLFAATAALVGLGYAGLYVWAVLARVGWMARIRQANIVMALALIAAAALWLTLLNPEAIAARSQLARYAAGQTPAPSLDVEAIGGWGRPGARAMARLEEMARTDPALAARLADPSGAPGVDAAPLRASLAALVPLQPAGATATRDFLFAAADAGQLQGWLTACQAPLSGGSPGCVLVVADLLTDKPGEEALFVLRDPSGWMRFEGLFLEDGVLQTRGVISNAAALYDLPAGEALIALWQQSPPPLSPAPLNRLGLGDEALMLQP